ncbi:MAG: hypothetical protein LBB34_02795 [Holosporales bacterium]|jgi:hypothetical protein|nr:hypothetical protein [Holosporales bacterium]
MISDVARSLQNVGGSDGLAQEKREALASFIAYIKSFVAYSDQHFELVFDDRSGGVFKRSRWTIVPKKSLIKRTNAVDLVHGINVVLSQRDEEIFKATVASRKEINLEDALRGTSVYPQLKLSGVFDQLITPPHHNG